MKTQVGEDGANRLELHLDYSCTAKCVPNNLTCSTVRRHHYCRLSSGDWPAYHWRLSEENIIIHKRLQYTMFAVHYDMVPTPNHSLVATVKKLPWLRVGRDSQWGPSTSSLRVLRIDSRNKNRSRDMPDKNRDGNKSCKIIALDRSVAPSPQHMQLVGSCLLYRFYTIFHTVFVYRRELCRESQSTVPQRFGSHIHCRPPLCVTHGWIPCLPVHHNNT